MASARYPDSELLLQIAGADQQAFNELFERYRDRLFAYLFSVTKDREASEELVLDTFLKIWQNRATLPELDHFEAFLFHIARNKSLDFFRQLQRNRERQTALWNIMYERQTGLSADQALLKEEVLKAIRMLVAEMPPQRRMVFRLSREQGLTYEQIAQRMNISPHTVRNHLAVSLRQIRAGLNSKYHLIALIFLLGK
ncbi:RNA polymerase sigma-70 factor [Chitinophaga qingshengii]|uniref:RNA polymerase sigma-70 factor n=2 Tax=Chitinophaga qingshengii TaxID=1569794 RepID=A0ABR7TIM4_9BACT|nr:RNA polymerase sigma-70 factor [Chitinophaga qingshengii]